MVKPAKNTICLWYDGDAEDAARFYAKTFPDSSVGAVHRAPGDFPSGKKGDVLTVEFTVMGVPCLGLNGGPAFKHNEAFSFQVATADQAETDRYWNAIVGNGGQESACGWCKDKWGLSWQITPIALTKAVTDPDTAAAKRAFDAMMQMKKIDIAAIEAARRGGTSSRAGSRRMKGRSSARLGTAMYRSLASARARGRTGSWGRQGWP
jgi:2-polyprenyl-6-hydroxyphenyl methylase/3-demethylubiquinone-9 3-methyltransferase